MIDYVKIKVIGCNINELLNNHLLDFHRSVSEKTGELGTFTETSYNKCKIKVYDSGTVLFSGSIHKMHNSIRGIEAPNNDLKGFNGNQFQYQDIISARQHICDLFNVSQKSLQIKNIEFGLNLHTSFNPQDLIDGLLVFEGKNFQFYFDDLYAQSIHQQYIIKIYNKGNQYGMSSYTLRFEIKILKMAHQRSGVGIRTMADIDLATMYRAFDYLKNQLRKVLYFDVTIKTEDLDSKQRGKLKDYRNPRYWSRLIPKKRLRDKKKLITLIESKSKNLKAEISFLLDQERERFNQLSEVPKRERFNHSTIGLNNTLLTDRICPITGLSLEHEKEGVKYALTTTLKNLKKNDKNKFAEVCSILLSKTKGNSPKYETDKISHLAKQIRNRYYNGSLIKEVGYNQKKSPKNQLGIFLVDGPNP